MVRFSAPLAAGSAMPHLSPHVAGSWRRAGTAAVFTPAAGWMGGTQVTVTVPGGRGGAQSAAGAARHAGGRLASAVHDKFSTAPLSTLRLQQLLARLGYLPLSWSPAGAPVAGADAAGQLAAAYHPPAGSFAWHGGYPAQLARFWSPGHASLVDDGAIRAFESQNGLAMDGTAGPRVWAALFHDIAAGKANTAGYTYALASEASPETLTIWHDGHQVLHSAANTGIPAAPTAQGTFPVYERLRSQIMKGTNPDGSHYADPVQYVAYFNGGDAVHYFPRSSFGYPQSLGCVELPLGEAAAAWPYLTYGSLVTVTG
jgi:peptidoglycan hydrolase-like protein with peptidoglycan-binding domain